MSKQKELVRSMYIKPECNLLNTYTGRNGHLVG